jgi:hypothetical protein
MTQVADDVAELNEGKITVQQLGERWAARSWIPVPSAPRTAEATAAIEPDDTFGPPGSWSEVQTLFAKGLLSRSDYFEVIGVIDKIIRPDDKVKAGRVPPPQFSTSSPPPVGHRHPTKIELSAKTDFQALQKHWEDEIQKLLNGWGDIKEQQILDLQGQIQNAVSNQSADQVAAIMTTVTGEDLILKHMTAMMESSVVDAKLEAERQGLKLSTIDTSDVTRTLQRQSAAMGKIMARSISNSAATQALTRYGVDALSGEDVANLVGDHLSSLSPSYAEDMLGGALTQAQNQGRMAVFSQSAGTYYSSELLDKNTCEECEKIDGHDYATLADAEADYPQGGYSECLGGPRCRGTIVAVYDEAHTDIDNALGDDDDETN